MRSKYFRWKLKSNRKEMERGSRKLREDGVNHRQVYTGGEGEGGE